MTFRKKYLFELVRMLNSKGVDENYQLYNWVYQLYYYSFWQKTFNQDYF